VSWNLLEEDDCDGDAAGEFRAAFFGLPTSKATDLVPPPLLLVAVVLPVVLSVVFLPPLSFVVVLFPDAVLFPLALVAVVLPVASPVFLPPLFFVVVLEFAFPDAVLLLLLPVVPVDGLPSAVTVI
jgi:hypothetical protein